MIARAAVAAVAATLVFATTGAAEEPSVPVREAMSREAMAWAGFPPTFEVPNNVEARRMMARDPYGFLAVPGLEVERRADGGARLRIVTRASLDEWVALPAGSWETLAASGRRAFMPEPPRPSPPANQPTPPPPPICHGWSFTFSTIAAGRVDIATGGECGGSAAGLRYAAELARLAVATRPACAFNAADPLWSFQKCFAPPPD